MDCSKIDEMMSLQLDGLLARHDEQSFFAHVAECDTCAPVWEAMQFANSLLLASAREPLPAPEGFTLKVMEKVAASTVVRPATEAVPAEAIGPAVVLPSLLPPQFAGGENVFTLPEINLQEWQHRIGQYARGAAAFAVAVAAGFGALLALLVSGTLQTDASFAPAVSTLRTFFSSLDTWASTLAAGFGTQVLVVGGIVMGLMALAAWQIVNSYHRSAETPYEMTGGEAAA